MSERARASESDGPTRASPAAPTTSNAFEPDAAAARTLSLVLACIWSGFAIHDGAYGFYAVMSAQLFAVAACVAFRAWSTGRSARAIVIGIHALLAVNLAALIVAGLMKGQSRSASAWYLTSGPLIASYLLGVDAALAWGTIAIVTLAVLDGSEHFVTITPVYRYEGARLFGAQVLFMVSQVALGVVSRRATDANIAGLRARERTIRQQADDLEVRSAELARARDAALTASHLKTEFLASISHEIRTPLNGVLGTTGVLLDGPLTDEQRDLVETVRTSGDALLTLLNDILDLSKIEAGKLAIEASPFDIRTCVDDAMELFAAQASGKGLAMATLVDRAVPDRVIGDAARVRQVLVNLIGNAVKFTHAGEIEVRVEVEATNAKSRLCVSVRDTGIGIAPELIERLFQPFTQVDGAINRRYGGTGLGLAISARLVAMMGGKASVESAPGIGSRFTFTLDVDEVAEGGSSPRDLSAIEGKRVAVVIARSLSARAAALALETLGATVDVIATDVGGVDPSVGELDLVVTDSATSAQALRDKLDRGPIPAVVTIARGDAAMRAAVHRLSHAVSVNEPLRVDALLSAIGATFSGELAPRSTRLPRPSLPPLASRHPLRVLLVEDNHINQKVALLMLAGLGYRADVVGSGEEALASLAERNYDVVLMDVQMPGMSGLEATEAIRRDLPKKKQPFIVAITANVMTEDRARCRAAGMNEFVGKPIVASELAAALARAPHSSTLTGSRIEAPLVAEGAKGARALAVARSATSTRAMPILALDAIDALHALTAADPAMLDELLDDHVSESARLQAALREAHARGDRDAARASAHSIRGSAATLGAREVAAIAADIEQAILSGRALAETTDYIAELDGALVRARAAFADVRARRRPVA